MEDPFENGAVKRSTEVKSEWYDGPIESRNRIMPFGKYKNQVLSDIETSYLKWLYENIDLEQTLRLDVETVYEERLRGE